MTDLQADFFCKNRKVIVLFIIFFGFMSTKSSSFFRWRLELNEFSNVVDLHDSYQKQRIAQGNVFNTYSLQ